MIAALLVAVLLLSALSVTLYIESADSRRRLADDQNEIILQLGFGLGGVQGGIPPALDESLTSLERFGMAAVTDKAFDEIYRASRSLEAMFQSSEREHEVFEILGQASASAQNLFYDYVYRPLLANITTDTPLVLNSVATTTMLGLTPDFDEIANAVRIVDPDTLKASVSLMDLDAIYTASLHIKSVISNL